MQQCYGAACGQVTAGWRASAVAVPAVSPGVRAVLRIRQQAAVQVRRSVPDQLSLPETQDAVKYAKVAKVSYDSNVDQVLEHLQSFEVMTAARPKPFASLKREDIRIINYNTTIFDPTDFPGAIRTDTEVLLIRVPAAGFDLDSDVSSGSQLIVGFRGTETSLRDGFKNDLVTDLNAWHSSIRDMKGLPAGALDGPKYDKMEVHKGFLTSFNDLMTGGDNKQETMAEVAKELMDGKEPARVVCCGHSLGGALATLGAFWWAKTLPQIDVFFYGFASPRVGNEAFCSEFLAGTGIGRAEPAVVQGQVDKGYRFTHKGDVVPSVPFSWMGYDHVERAVFLCQPNDNGWGVVKKGSVPLSPGQTYAALLARRPGNYLGLRVLRPLVGNYHDMGDHVKALQNILEFSKGP